MQAGVACASVSGTGWTTRRACVSQRPLGDGAWHTVVAERHGHNLWVSVDDGEGWSFNETLESLDSLGGAKPPPPLMVDKHDGLTVGGLPEFTGVNLVTVHNDLQDGEARAALFCEFESREQTVWFINTLFYYVMTNF